MKIGLFCPLNPLCEVGKVLPSKKTNPFVFRLVMKSVWRVHQATRIDPACDNIFVVQFCFQLEKNTVLNSRPLNFDKALLVA